MLVLSRQRDETIMIGDDIEITVVDIRGDKVRLGINAPRTVQVHRKEVYDAIRTENAEASQVQMHTDDLGLASRAVRPAGRRLERGGSIPMPGAGPVAGGRIKAFPRATGTDPHE